MQNTTIGKRETADSMVDRVGEEDAMFNAGIPGLARAYQEQLRREADLRRLGDPVKRPELHRRARLLARAGRVLISIGSRLVDRYGPVLAGSPYPRHDVPGQVLG